MQPSTSARRGLSLMRALAAGLRDEARGFSLRGPRARQALRPVASVALAVVVAHALGLRDSWWAAISAFIVMQEAFGASLYRGLLRIVGTLAGAGLGLALGPLVAGHGAVFVLLLGGAAWGGLVAALLMRHSYAWVLGLVTFVMVMCEAMLVRGGLAAFAFERVANIGVGTAAGVLVVGLFELRLGGLPGWGGGGALIRAAADAAAPAPAQRADAAWHASSGALAVALLALAVTQHALSAFPQAMVTTIAVLIVPLGSDEAVRRQTVAARMLQRCAGCLAAGGLALALLPLAANRPWACQLALALGIWIGAYLQRGAAGVRYLAIQFSVAFLMVFVQDSGWTVDGALVLERLGGIFAGIAALSLVLALSGWLRRPQRRPVG